MIVWSDSLMAIIPSCHEFQRKLTRLVMRSLTSPVSVDLSSPTSATPMFSPDVSSAKLNTENSGFDSKIAPDVSVTEKEIPADQPLSKPKKGRNCWGFGHVVPDKSNELETGSTTTKRKTRLLAPFYGGLGAALSICELARS